MSNIQFSKRVADFKARFSQLLGPKRQVRNFPKITSFRMHPTTRPVLRRPRDLTDLFPLPTQNAVAGL